MSKKQKILALFVSRIAQHASVIFGNSPGNRPVGSDAKRQLLKIRTSLGVRYNVESRSTIGTCSRSRNTMFGCLHLHVPVCINTGSSRDPVPVMSLLNRQATTFENSIADMLDTVGKVPNNQEKNMIGERRLTLQKLFPALST